MLIIDRYVLRQFLAVLGICSVCLTGMYIVFDALSNLDEFQRFAKDGRDLLTTMAGFYAYRSIYFFDRVSGILVMTAAMVTVAWLRRHNELTALMAAGVSRLRVVAPVIAAACAFSLLSAANREWLIPMLRQELARNPKDLAGKAGQPLKQRFDHSTGILFQGLQTFAAEQRIEKPEFVLPPALEIHGKRLAGANAFYQPADGERPAGYLLRGVRQPAALLANPSLTLGGRKVVVTPVDATDWLAPDECFVVSEVDFAQLCGGHAWRQFSSTRELIAGLANPSLAFGADVRVAVHTRLIQPLFDIVLLFLSLPLLLGREQKNVFLAIGQCAAISTAFLVVLIAARYLGSNYYISPAKAAWAPLVIFTPAATALFDRMRK